MGDAAGQLSQRLGLQRLDERGLGLLSLGDLMGELLVRLQELARALGDAILELLITGSVGKTSTKEMLKIVLGGQANTFASKARSTITGARRLARPHAA